MPIMQMDNSKLLVVGIDPGTTTAYAVLDLSGNVVSVKSAKNLGINALLAEVMQLGKIVVIGTDKAKIPSLVEDFSAKTGARIVYPKEDLKVEEKKSMVKEFKTENDHQDDALASSLFAFKRIKPVLERIDVFVKENKKENIKDNIINLVLTKEVSIREAADIIENYDKEEVRIIKKVIEEKTLRQSDFMRLYRIAKRYEKEFMLLKRQNDNLKIQLKGLERKYSYLDPKAIATKIDKRFQRNILFKEKSIDFLEKEIGRKNDEIRNLHGSIRKFNDILSNINNIFILKKLDNLGSAEFNKKQCLLNIAKNDILLVDNPNIISDDVVNFLKGKVGIIITKATASSKIRQKCGITLINLEGINVEETNIFAFASRKEIENILKSKDVLESVIEDYKKSREYLSKSL